MNSRPTVHVFTFLLAVCLCFADSIAWSQAPDSSGTSKSSQDSVNPESTTSVTGAGAALQTMFSPVHAPRRKTMGLLQRSFVDLATRSDDVLQVAVVVDGTESMSMELASVRKSIQTMLDDLNRCRGEVQVAMVVYRDSRSPSGETERLLKQFTSDRESISDAVSRLKSETGEPFFHELADVGVHEALSKLDWSEDPAVTRWVLWFGDAPPYEDGFRNEDYPHSRRRFTNDLLMAIAQRKGIQINGVLCNSSQNVSDSYEKAVDQTRSFIGELVTGTDGLMIDLSYPEIRSALLQASSQPVIDYTAIAPITANDLRSTGSTVGSNDEEATTTGPVRIAVLPYQDLANVSFDPSLASVQIATAVRHRFGQLSAVRVTSPVDVQRQLRRLKAEGIAADEILRSLGARLGVDYVVWGEVQPPELADAQVRTAAYQRSDGRPVFSVVSDSNPNEVARVVVDAAATKPSGKQSGVQGSDEANGRIDSLAARLRANNAQLPVEGDVAISPAATREILTAIESLDQALGQDTGSDASNRLLATAEMSVASAIKTEPQNALAHWLRANIAMNQATAFFAAGDNESAKKSVAQVKSSLRRAKRGSRKLSPSIAEEIKADEALLVRRDVGDAIKTYEELTQEGQPSATRLRAHWMLAGLYAGDWGVASQASDHVDAAKVREHIIAVLRGWPESPSADMMRRWIRWDEKAGRSQFQHFPKSNAGLADLAQ